MGNHEAMLRLAIEPKTPWDVALDALANWLRNGGAIGRAAVRSTSERLPEGPEELLTVDPRRDPRARCGAGCPALSGHCRSGSVLFVHAGRQSGRCRSTPFSPTPWNVPLAELDEDRHWAWVRWPFLEHQSGAGRLRRLCSSSTATRPTTRGARPRSTDQIARFRLNLDAGSGRTGVAKMAILRGDEAKVVTAMGPTDAMLSGVDRVW